MRWVSVRSESLIRHGVESKHLRRLDKVVFVLQAGSFLWKEVRITTSKAFRRASSMEDVMYMRVKFVDEIP